MIDDNNLVQLDEGKLQNILPREMVGARALDFSIDEIETYSAAVATKKFQSGQVMMVKCKITHPEGFDKIEGANITIIHAEYNIVLLDNTSMIKLPEQQGATWLWYSYTFSFTTPTPRGLYDITVFATSNKMGDPEVNESKSIEILNELPEIVGEIPSLYLYEDNEDNQNLILDLSQNKSDLEDFGNNLKWYIENVNESLLSIIIEGDNITINLIPNASGFNQLKLILEDSDNDSVFTWFWVNVEPFNDPPELKAEIPNQEKPEDSPPWSINLTQYVYDVEDTPMHRLLTWVAEDVNNSFIKIEIITTAIANSMYIYPLNDVYGSDLVTIHAFDSLGASVTQTIWINLTLDNDPPIWTKIPKLYVNTPDARGVLQLLDFITDIDTHKDQITLEIFSTTPEFIKCTVDNGKLNINSTNTNYVGPGTIVVNASDGDNEVSTTIEVKFFLAPFAVYLLAPQNISFVTTNLPYLHWGLENPAELEPVRYDVYLDTEENNSLVFNLDAKAIVSNRQRETSYGGIYQLLYDTTYYWTVVPIYIDNNGEEYIGETVGGIYSFKIDITHKNQPPISAVVYPLDGQSIKNHTVNLTWLGYDPDNDKPITFKLYFGTDREAVRNHETDVKIELPDPTTSYHIITDLKENEIYYWTIIPSVNGIQGKCISEVSSFSANIYNSKPSTILLLPSDNVTVQKSPILYWDFSDPDPFEDLTFEIFLDKDKTRVSSLDPTVRIATVRKVTNYYLHFGEQDERYYWTVIGYDKEETGVCECGVWSFKISENQTNYPPVTTLKEPKDGITFYKDSIKLSWNGSDADNDNIKYTVYFGDDYNSISNLDMNYKLRTITTTSFEIDGLIHDKTYYWTVIPDDGKVPGGCLDRIWSFETDLKHNPKADESDESSRTFLMIQILIICIILIVVISLFAWLTRKARFEKRVKKYLQTGSESHLPKELQSRLFSSSTLHAFRTKETQLSGDISDSGEKKLEEDLSLTTQVSDSELSEEVPSQPYIDGEYDYDIAKSKYRPRSKLAEHVKRAIPYATAPQKHNHITTKSDIELAKPISKKIATDAPLKASSLPITKECPQCGSFKVKTYKDDTSKCLDCKFKF